MTSSVLALENTGILKPLWSLKPCRFYNIKSICGDSFINVHWNDWWHFDAGPPPWRTIDDRSTMVITVTTVHNIFAPFLCHQRMLILCGKWHWLAWNWWPTVSVQRKGKPKYGVGKFSGILYYVESVRNNVEQVFCLFEIYFSSIGKWRENQSYSSRTQ